MNEEFPAVHLKDKWLLAPHSSVTSNTSASNKHTKHFCIGNRIVPTDREMRRCISNTSNSGSESPCTQAHHFTKTAHVMNFFSCKQKILENRMKNFLRNPYKFLLCFVPLFDS